MLRDLSIHNYRCFQDFHIDDLARVNLIVGMNNSGKTSLLEAVYLLADQSNPHRLLDLLDIRGEIAPLGDRNSVSQNYQISHIFPEHKLNFEQNILIQSHKDKPISVQIQLAPITQSSQIVEDVSEINDQAFELIFELILIDEDEVDLKMKAPLFQDGSFERRSFKSTKPSKQPLNSSIQGCEFLLATRDIGFDYLAKLWDKITLTPKEESLVKALQILEPDVERMSFTSSQTTNSGILLKLRGRPHPIPLGSMGEGMRRILALSMTAVTAENNVLLVDEIETGLHYEKQTDMWRLVLQMAKQLNIQVFATTHSWDCICAFQEALDELEDQSIGKLFRLSQKGDKIIPVEYTPEELSAAVRQSIEVR